MYQKSAPKAKLLALLGLTLMLLLASTSALAAALTGSTTADKVLFRTRPNTSSDYHAKLPKGTKVALLDIEGDFYKVRFDGKTGYIMQSFLKVSSSTRNALKEATAPKSTSKFAKVSSISGLGDAPKQMRYGAAGTDVEKLQRALQIKDFYEGIVDGKFGNQTKVALEKYQKRYKLEVNGRADYATIKKLFGTVGETTVEEDPGMNGVRSISQITVPNTTERGDRGKHVKALQQALKIKGYYKAEIDSSYGQKTVDAVAAFQKRVGLENDGIAGNATILKLFGKNAANHSIKTEDLDWFKDGTATIPKGAIFTIKDIGTGRTFTMRRWSGANHLDAEPINEKSTQTLKDIYGGNWSWERRAVLVRYDGHVYAASINGMPHGTSTVKGNDFDGHICVHFLNSRTHETDREDPAHQSAVRRAGNATW